MHKYIGTILDKISNAKTVYADFLQVMQILTREKMMW